MSTRSLICKEVGEDEFLAIYCHSDGYPEWTGKKLLDSYNTEEMVDKLLGLGDLSVLDDKLEPTKENHSFDTPESGVTVAYARDRGEKKETRILSLKRLDSAWEEFWAEFVYVFTKDKEWKFFEPGKYKRTGLKNIADYI